MRRSTELKCIKTTSKVFGGSSICSVFLRELALRDTCCFWKQRLQTVRLLHQQNWELDGGRICERPLCYHCPTDLSLSAQSVLTAGTAGVRHFNRLLVQDRSLLSEVTIMTATDTSADSLSPQTSHLKYFSIL